ncbi:MAG: glycine cleavage system aminomethyltransferase GcvT [Proteobacteria bacterium]|nr:glycine cleavage system aminomethyltransferase GcvT [Pseudomonadota bacterium]
MRGRGKVPTIQTRFNLNLKRRLSLANSIPQTARTVLFAEHVAQNAKMVPFGEWTMPVSYAGVLAEHRSVREFVGLFDVSHMGEIRVKGPDATRYLQRITINDIAKLKDGDGQYSAILNESGGMIDDLIVYRLASDEYFICVNASNSSKDFDWLLSQSKSFQVTLNNESPDWAQIAVQGPHSARALRPFLSDIDSLAYTQIRPVTLFGQPCYIARTGYTGELGYEVYIPNSAARNLWLGLMERSGETGVKPIGLGARDTLRLESCYLLYGNDMDDTVSPLEAGISWATKFDKGDFIGRAALVQQKATGVMRKIVAFKMIDEGIPRHGMQVIFEGLPSGKVTSGSVLPTVGGAGGMAMVSSLIKEGDEISIDVRGNHRKARVVKRPLYQAKVK